MGFSSSREDFQAVEDVEPLNQRGCSVLIFRSNAVSGKKSQGFAPNTFITFSSSFEGQMGSQSQNGADFSSRCLGPVWKPQK